MEHASSEIEAADYSRVLDAPRNGSRAAWLRCQESFSEFCDLHSDEILALR